MTNDSWSTLSATLGLRTSWTTINDLAMNRKKMLNCGLLCLVKLLMHDLRVKTMFEWLKTKLSLKPPRMSPWLWNVSAWFVCNHVTCMYSYDVSKVCARTPIAVYKSNQFPSAHAISASKSSSGCPSSKGHKSSIDADDNVTTVYRP